MELREVSTSASAEEDIVDTCGAVWGCGVSGLLLQCPDETAEYK